VTEPIDRAAKQDLRRRMLASRRSRGHDAIERAGAGLTAQVTALVERCGAHTVAAYVSMAAEPPTRLLIERLHAQGVTVLLPVIRADDDLDWATFEPEQTRVGRLGVTEPTGTALGVAAIQSAQVVCCPGLGGSMDGRRLGRGGGSYDRALARTLPGSLRCLLLYDDEVLADVPTEPHDQPVDLLVTPTRTIPCSPARFV